MVRPRARARIGVVMLLQLPHLHAAGWIEGELQEAGGEAGLRAQLLHAQLACLAQRRVDEQVGLQRLVEGGEQLGRRLHDEVRAPAHVSRSDYEGVLERTGNAQ